MHDPDTLRELFAAAREGTAADWRGSGTDEILKKLSKSVAAAQRAGLDVSLEMRPFCSQQAFAMIREHYDDTTRIAQAYGRLRIGEMTFLLAIGRPKEIREVVRAPGGGITGRVRQVTRNMLFMSTDEIDHQGGKEAVRSLIFDVLKDEAELEKFQSRIVDLAARSAEMRECDVERVFKTNDSRAAHKLKRRRLKIGEGG